MKTLYLDCFSGASGDMLLGSLFDLGLNRSRWMSEMKKLRLPEKWKVQLSKEERHGISGVHLEVKVAGAQKKRIGVVTHSHYHHHHDHDHSHDHGTGSHSHSHTHHEEGAHCHDSHESTSHHDHSHGRSWRDIRGLIEKSKLSPSVKKRASAAFLRLAEAEGKIHGKSPEKVTFHEVGAVDSIVDTIGFCLGLELLGIDRVLCSPLVDGRGFVRAAHGMLPIPVPATLECLKGIPIQQSEEPFEMITPTAACLLAEWVEKFALMEFEGVERIGYGVGSRHLKSRPNVVRAILLKENEVERVEKIQVLETQVDDCTGQQLGHLMSLLFKAGAFDVFYTAVQMKKNRPGVLISVFCRPPLAVKLRDLIFIHTTTFGIRMKLVERTILESRFVKGKVKGKGVQFREGWLRGKKIKSQPEFEEIKEIV